MVRGQRYTALSNRIRQVAQLEQHFKARLFAISVGTTPTTAIPVNTVRLIDGRRLLKPGVVRVSEQEGLSTI
jgi:hypothetical protein